MGAISPKAPLVPTDAGLALLSAGTGEAAFRVYTGDRNRIPSWEPVTDDCIVESEQGWFTNFRVKYPDKKIELEVQRVHDHKVVIGLQADAHRLNLFIGLI
ncbi:MULTISPECIES: hypothetical protein [Paenibacillus]|uniref:hypothetical protein n=1 Tax=Paenibacillus TaxID=44249 RepID=UPI0022B8891D|nr:hypothetical protein [Paenibacillus caseinilyticus]MCZ8521383.1 hypothetical protein [Paenibacillus caseinilyticus]